MTIRKNSRPLAKLQYRSEPRFEVASGRTALVIVDVQYSCAHRDHGDGLEARAKGMVQELAHRFEHIDKIIPNIQLVQRACRAAGIEVIFVRIAGLTEDGRDHPQRPRPHYSTKDAQILEEIAPVGDEIVISKTTSSAFTSSHIDYLLRSMRIENLFVCGVSTGSCVEMTARDASDLDYRVIVIGDCCATDGPDAHVHALEAMNQFRMRVKDTAEVIAMIEAAVPRSLRSAGDDRVRATAT